MKFKEGNAVEVLRKKEESCGSWFPAKIISVDKDKYTVRFELFMTVKGDPMVEKVLKEDVRPCPPPVGRGEKWFRGDITEVLDLHSWRAGKVAKVLRNNWLVIRLFGSIQLKEFQSSSLRVRQAWHDNQWITIGKGGGNNQIDYNHPNSSFMCSQNFLCGARGGGNGEGCTKALYNTFSSERIVKRNMDSSFHSSSDDAVNRGGVKRKATLEVGGSQVATRILPKQVDAVTSTKITVGEKCMHSSKMIGSSYMDVERGNQNIHAMHPFSIPLQVFADECSVASCSSNNLVEYTVYNSQESSGDIVGSSFDDAKSSCPYESGNQYSHCAKDKIEANIHRLELHAYQSTVQALYASGPLSWEQELLLTNLRLSLHISNEEHLIQLRHLLAAQVL